MKIIGYFGIFVYFDSQTKKITFEEIKTSSKFNGKNPGFMKTKYVESSVEQITYLTVCYVDLP